MSKSLLTGIWHKDLKNVPQNKLVVLSIAQKEFTVFLVGVRVGDEFEVMGPSEDKDTGDKYRIEIRENVFSKGLQHFMLLPDPPTGLS